MVAAGPVSHWHLCSGNFGYGAPKSPFVRPETGLGERGHFRVPKWA